MTKKNVTPETGAALTADTETKQIENQTNTKSNDTQSNNAKQNVNQSNQTNRSEERRGGEECL